MKLILKSTLYVVVLTVLLGGIYPAVIYGIGQLFWREKANGSFVASGGRVVGSELIGQGFHSPKYLHSRPSAPGIKEPSAFSFQKTWETAQTAAG